jgi:hypothetical protein
MAEVFVRKPEFLGAEEQGGRGVGEASLNQLRPVFEAANGMLKFTISNRGCADHEGAAGDGVGDGREFFGGLE